jgi:cytoskeleton protein RodZ
MKTIGTRLKEARDYRQLSLEKVAVDTHIRLRFLQALEADDFSAMPSAVQARGFLRNYAHYLGLNLDAIIAEMHQEEANRAAEEGIIFEGDSSLSSQVETGLSPTESEPEQQIPKLPFWQKWVNLLNKPPDLQMETGQAEDSEATENPTQANNKSLEEDDPSDNAAGMERIDVPKREFKDSGAPDPEQDANGSESAPPQTLEKEIPEDRPDAGEPEPAVETRQSIWNLLVEWIKSFLDRRQKRTDQGFQPVIDEIEAPEADHRPTDSTERVPTSREILDEIGSQLRERREMLSLTLEEIERHTHMRAQFLRALESGDFEELPSTVQTRGMLNNYAQFLDLDIDSILLRFADALQARHRERYPEKIPGLRGQPHIPNTIPRIRSFIAGDLVFGFGMMILLVGFAIWGIASVISLQSQQADIESESNNPSISEALIGTPVEAVETQVTLIPAADTPIPGLPEGTLEIATPLENVAVQINIVVVERTYLLVRVDGEVQFDGRALPGNAYPFEAEQSIDIVAGNAAALRVVYNQRDLGLMGGFGELVNYVFTAEEILTPTLEPTATPTFTPPVTPTLSPTPSATPTLPAEAGTQ